MWPVTRGLSEDHREVMLDLVRGQVAAAARWLSFRTRHWTSAEVVIGEPVWVSCPRPDELSSWSWATAAPAGSKAFLSGR